MQPKSDQKPLTMSAEREAKQREIDIANLRFYAEMFEQHQWSTVVIHWGVFKQTLNEIAERIAAHAETRERLRAQVKETEESFNTVSRICGEVLLERDSLQERLEQARIRAKPEDEGKL